MRNKSTNCIPYHIIFGRSPVLPQDTVFHPKISNEHDHLTATEYLQEVASILRDVFEKVVESLQLNKKKMQEYCNKNLRFDDFQEGQLVWLTAKHYKTGENRKLASALGLSSRYYRTVSTIKSETLAKKQKSSTMIETKDILINDLRNHSKQQTQRPRAPSSDTDSSILSSDDASSYIDGEGSGRGSGREIEVEKDNNRNYPTRNRTARVLPGSIPWTALKI
eukprot:gene223-9861_t